MGSSYRLFGRQRTVHQILGGGFFADVMLWRRKDLTVGIISGGLAAWLWFELSGYTLLSLASNELLLLFFILFAWAKCAEILNRPPPPVPELHIPEDVVSEATVFIRSQLGYLLTVPVLYEKYEDVIDKHVLLSLTKLQMYESVYADFFTNAKDWFPEKMKES